MFYVMAFDCLIFLLHQIMGPVWIYETFYIVFERSCSLFFFVASHYYICSFLFLIVCVWSIVHRIMRFLNFGNKSSQVNDIRQDLMDLNEKVDNLESKIEEILASLARIELQLN